MIFFGLDVLDFIASSSGVLPVDLKQAFLLAMAFTGMSTSRHPKPRLIYFAVLQLNEHSGSAMLTAKSIQG